MAAIYGGVGGDVSVQDIGGYGFQRPPPPHPYTYTVQPGVISGIDTATTFTGQEAERVEAYVTGVAREQAVFDANQPTISERIAYANRETMGAIRGTTETGGDFAAAPFGVPLPLIAAVGLLFLIR